jgi:hypothetical protein
MNVQRRDLGFDPPSVTQQQIALLTRRLMPTRAVGLVRAHILDAHAHRAQANTFRLEHGEICGNKATIAQQKGGERL